MYVSRQCSPTCCTEQPLLKPWTRPRMRTGGSSVWPEQTSTSCWQVTLKEIENTLPKGTVRRKSKFKWPSMKRGQCPIYISTLSTVVCSSSTEFSVCKLIENRLFLTNSGVRFVQHELETANTLHLFNYKSGFQTL